MLKRTAMGVTERIVAHAERLTSTERRIAEVLTREPQAVAFGTVAGVARLAETSGPSVVRLAVKLGYEGFVDLQADVQAELARQLAPARERIRQKPAGDLMGRAHSTEIDNVARSLQGIELQKLEACAQLLSDRRLRVWVMVSTMLTPAGAVLATQLGQLREGVSLLSGSEMAMGRQLAGFSAGDVVVAIDIRRYEASLARLVRWAKERGAVVIALTDGPLAPIAAGAREVFYIFAEGIGPFDSVTGAVAVANLLAAACASRLRHIAAGRLDAIESAWASTEALVEASPPPEARPPTGGRADGAVASS
jgi:DNA-binding MurR/RpiR family transcriptional regulator